MTSYSTDGGASWVHDTCDDVNARGTCIAFDPDNAGRVFVGGDSGYSYRFLKVTTDLGATCCIVQARDERNTVLAAARRCLTVGPDGSPVRLEGP